MMLSKCFKPRNSGDIDPVVAIQVFICFDSPSNELQ